jgi:hypothetical protein
LASKQLIDSFCFIKEEIELTKVKEEVNQVKLEGDSDDEDLKEQAAEDYYCCKTACCKNCF